MTTEETELTFVRCPTCRGLVPAVASRCRMCGHHFEAEGDEGGDAGAHKKSRVRQRTISVSKQEMFGAGGDPAEESIGGEDSPFGRGFDSSFGQPQEDEDLLRESADEAPSEEELPVEPEFGRRPARPFEQEDDDDRPLSFGARKGARFEEAEEEEVQEEPVEPWGGSARAAAEDDDLSAADDLGDDDMADEGDDDEAIDVNAPRKKRRRRKRRRGGTEQGAQLGGGEPQRSEAPRSEAPRSEAPRSEALRNEQPRHEHAEPVRVEPARVEPERIEPQRIERPAFEPREEPARDYARVNEAKRGDTMGTHESGLDDEKFGRSDRGASAGKGKGPKREEHGTLLGWLVNYSQDSKGISVELRGGRFFLGRQRLRDDDLVIADSSISTPHCLLFVARGEVKVQDLMSEHGTYVKKRGSDSFTQVHDTVDVQHGDSLRFGTYEVVLCLIP